MTEPKANSVVSHLLVVLEFQICFIFSVPGLLQHSLKSVTVVLLDYMETFYMTERININRFQRSH